jgi:hypothetical protein
MIWLFPTDMLHPSPWSWKKTTTSPSRGISERGRSFSAEEDFDDDISSELVVWTPMLEDASVK